LTVTNEAKRNEDTVEPLVRLRYPTAQSKLAEIIAKLTDIVTHADHYCNEAVSDARHDLAALEAARLYKPNVAVSLGWPKETNHEDNQEAVAGQP
jgi:hypothetical protein